MGKKDSGAVKPTAMEIAQAEVGAQQMQDWQARWAPVLKDFSANTLKAMEPGSYERRHATALAGVDTAARFGQAQDMGLRRASQNGIVGSSRQKLAVTGMGQDQATSNAFGAVAADQAVDDATTQGLGAVAALGAGQRATAANSLADNARMSGERAYADAESSLQNRIGNAGLASTIAGTGIGLWQGVPKKPRAGIIGNDIALGY